MIFKKIHATMVAIMIGFLTAVAGDYGLVTNVPYSQNRDEYSKSRCVLDVYYPQNEKDAPVVVWFHGGGLTGGQKEIPAELKESGMVVVGVNYRLMPKVTIDACIDDAAAAVAWVFKNATIYNGSAQKIFVAGHSAGGYLTSMIGLERKWLEKYGVNADSIAALIPYSGQAITHFAHRKMQGINELQATVDEFAPLYHVRGDSAPYIIITGDAEDELYGRYEENTYMWRMMKLAGHKQVYLYKIDGYNHGAMARPAHHILKKFVRKITGK